MTCKDCVKYDACLAYNGGMTRTISMKNKAEEMCGLFKNKADFAEVPCRCEKCKHWERFRANPQLGNCSNEENGLFEFTNPEDFCSYGERKKR